MRSAMKYIAPVTFFIFFLVVFSSAYAFRVDDRDLTFDPVAPSDRPAVCRAGSGPDGPHSRFIAGEVISSIPSPSMPFGLTWDGECLWVGSYDAILYRLNPEDGSIVYQIDAPGTVASGLAWDWHMLWVSDRDADVVRRFDPSDGSVLVTHDAPGPYPGGLGWDGLDLWHSNYYDPSHIYYMDHVTGDILDDFPAPDVRGMGITWDGISLWNGDYIGDKIYELDPETGDVINSFATPDDNAHDLAYDGHYLWVVIGGGANMLYQLEPGNKEVSVGLAPQSTTVSPGGILRVNGSLLNHTEEVQAVELWVDIYLPNGNPYPGNPLLGPMALPVPPGAYLSRTVSHPVPGRAPTGDYRYQAVLTIDDQVVDVTEFNFTIE